MNYDKSGPSRELDDSKHKSISDNIREKRRAKIRGKDSANYQSDMKTMKIYEYQGVPSYTML